MTEPSGAFWSGETLLERLPSLIQPFTPSLVDCAAYTLTVGSEVYVSPSDQSSEPNLVTVKKLDDRGGFTIPAGQFAFIVTHESITVPDNALAFISIRARVKFRGLVNVSGFHVDPGYQGKLTFSVFNAGPVTIHLKQGQPIFLIWYASLDRSTKFLKGKLDTNGLDPDLITSVSGELQSFASLSKKIKDTEKSLVERVHSVERQLSYVQVLGAIVFGLLMAWAGSKLKDSTPPGGTATGLVNAPAASPGPPASGVP